MKKKLVRKEFIAWLRQQDGSPCGTHAQCPIATYLEIGSSAASRRAQRTLWGAKFVKWADGWRSPGSRSPACQWGLITGDEAADFLEGKLPC